METDAKVIECQHEPWCSKPETYCRYVEKMEILDEHGNVIEVIEPGIPEEDVATITCVECSKQA